MAEKVLDALELRFDKPLKAGLSGSSCWGRLGVQSEQSACVQRCDGLIDSPALGQQGGEGARRKQRGCRPGRSGESG